MNGYPLKIIGITANKMGIRATEIEQDDSTLVAQALTGRLSSFKELVFRYRNQAFFFARAMVGDPDDAYDLSQEAFIRIHRHLKKFDPEYSFKTWFFHILSNLCKNHLRHRKIKNRYTTSLESVEGIAVSKTDRPDIAYQRNETQQRVWQAIEKLPEKFKEIIILNHFEEMSYDQISRVLDIPRGSVMSRLYYARQKLREILEKRGVSL